MRRNYHANVSIKSGDTEGTNRYEFSDEEVKFYEETEEGQRQLLIDLLENGYITVKLNEIG